MSPPEALLWSLPRQRHPDMPTFRRQHPIGPYVADFFCSAARLVVEVDGAHHGEDEQSAHDQARGFYMARQGYRVIRIPAGELMRDPEGTASGVVETAQVLIGQR
jgi:very-short-patch-repair endonuclease